ncbi:21781_t:CDS:2, partial [Dentiscutata erythropus]
MKNAAKKNQGKPTQEYLEAQNSKLDEEWENENELINVDEYMTQEWEEELINSELEWAINYQNLLLELDREANREITWLTENGYQNRQTNNYYLESEAQPMNCDEGEAAEGLEFEDSSDEEYEDTRYGCYQSHLEHNHYWWNTHKEDIDFNPNFNSEDWKQYQLSSDYIDWESCPIQATNPTLQIPILFKHRRGYQKDTNLKKSITAAKVEKLVATLDNKASEKLLEEKKLSEKPKE